MFFNPFCFNLPSFLEFNSLLNCNCLHRFIIIFNQYYDLLCCSFELTISRRSVRINIGNFFITSIVLDNIIIFLLNLKSSFTYLSLHNQPYCECHRWILQFDGRTARTAACVIVFHFSFFF